MLVCIVCIAAEVASHQLTPFAILLAILALMVVDRCSARGLATITAVLLATWLSFMTVDYLSGHIDQLTGSLGQLGGTVNESVGNRVAGSSGHLAVVYVRIGITAILLALALAGFVRRLRAGERSRSLAALALAPVLLAALQAYGGEIAMRVYLFALPFTAFFAAAALLPSYGRRLAWARTGALVAVCLLFVAGFGYARYGNERINLFSRAEVRAVEHMYDIAPRGALLVAGSTYLPWKAHDYANYDYEQVSGLEPSVFRGVKAPPTGPDLVGRGGQGKTLATDLAAFMQGRVTQKHLPGGFLILTRTQFAAERLLGSTGPVPLAALAPEVERSRRFRKVFDNGAGQVFQLVTRQRGGGR